MNTCQDKSRPTFCNIVFENLQRVCPHSLPSQSNMSFIAFMVDKKYEHSQPGQPLASV